MASISEDDEPRERRSVRSEDPSLSDDANRRLTEELRATVGADEVEVPVDRPHHESESHAKGSATRGGLRNLGLFAGIVVIAAGIALLLAAANSGDWGIAILAFLLDLAGLALVLRMVLGMTAEHKKPSPTLEAKLEAEGVANPEAMESQLAEEFRDRGSGRQD